MEPKEEKPYQEKKLSRSEAYFRKKKKKSFLQNAKGFGKKESFGRGSNLEKEDYQYFLEILKNINIGFENDSAKRTMANNVFENIKGKEFLLSSNQVACRALETLLPFTSGSTLETFATALTDDYRILCCDGFASFVLEKILKIATIRALSTNINEEVESSDSESEPEDDEGPAAKKKKVTKRPSSDLEYNQKIAIKEAHRIFCFNFLMKTSKFLLNNIEDFINNNFGNHIMRTSLQCLAGLITTPDPQNKTKFDTVNLVSQHSKEIPVEWKELVIDYSDRLQSWPQFQDLPYNEQSSCILQTICQALRNCQEDKPLKKLIKQILEKSFAIEDEVASEVEIKEEDAIQKEGNEERVVEKLELMPSIFNSNSTLHLLEAMIMNAGSKYLLKMYTRFFKDRLVALSEAKNLNFSVQKLMDAVQDKHLFELIFDEISPATKNLLCIGHTGIVVSLSKGCERLASKQGQFTQTLLKALNCAGDKSNKCIIPLLKLKPLEITEKEENFNVNLHGSVIFQQILQFNKPIKFVQCLLDLKPQELATIFCDPKGSHLADSYMKSKFIGEKSREKLIRHLEGLYIQLATSKHGSRVLDVFFELGAEPQWETIASELSERMNQLNGTQCGRIICQKYLIETFQRNKGQWKSSMAARQSTTKVVIDTKKEELD